MSFGVEAWGGGPTDTAAPTVANVVPPPNTPVNPADEIRFDVTDDSGELVLTLVTVNQKGIVEVAHDGERFVGLYGELSTRELVTGGHRYRIRRSGGWVSTPIFRVYAIDTVGNAT